MKNLKGITVVLLLAVAMLAGLSCIEQKGYTSPPGYDLNKPMKFNMSEGLLEISGIAFHHGNPDSLYAEQDEKGHIYYLKLGDKKTPGYSKFGKSGDYEDIAILNNQVVILRSDGVFFTFPFNQVRSGEIADVQKQEGMLPSGEYESMYADEKTNQLYVLCKNCSDDTKKSSSGYIFKMAANGAITQSGQFSVDVKDIEAQTGKKKGAFRPSAFAKNQSTNEWYILSSVNKLIVVTDAAFKIKGVYPISPSLFIQPEGIAFDNQNSLYISNEGDQVTPGTVYKFIYKK
ncbi:MAG: SdiA-regulated family protein [Bacteroidota bacterium]